MRANGAQTDNIEKIWYAGDYTGDNQPTARCTVHKGNVRLTNGGDYGDFASIIFSVGAEFKNGLFTYFPREIPNIKSVSWNRDVDNNVASATIEIYNTMNLTNGDIVRGYFTWNYGDSSFAKARGIQKNNWFGWLVPDNIIRTYEGYGADYDVGPEMDQHLLCTGNWMIDKVEIKSGLIVLTCRDFGRILLDQIFFPPITPRSSKIPGMQYPVSFSSFITVPNAQSEQYTPLFMNFDDSSSTPWVGHDGFQLGHYAREAMDGNSETYWLSVGNGAPNASYAYEWVQGNVGKVSVGSVNIHALYPNLQGFISCYNGTEWVDKVGTIPYDPAGVGAPNGSDIPAVARFVSTGLNQRVNFDPVPGTTKVRVTFTNLQDSGVGPYVYRAGVREFGVYSAKQAPQTYTRKKDAGFNYYDYTDLIKLFCAWAGFHWPKPSDGPFIAVSKAPGFPLGVAFELNATPANDNYLKNGRIWGDLAETGTYGVTPLTIDQFDKKTLMDGVTLIQQTVNFLFQIDESGGVQWRFPNYKNRGNVIQGSGQRVNRFIRILDTQTLLDITTTLDGRNARERIYIASPDGLYVGGARGYNLNPIGLRRVLGYIDKNWGSSKECQTAAQFTAVAQMMTYRTLDVTIPGLPTMQVDDQTEVVDVATGEGYLHYVRSIKSTLDMSQNGYTYELTTSWLGERAGGTWAFNQYGALSGDATTLLDWYDIHRTDGAYDSFGPVVIPGAGTDTVTTLVATPSSPRAHGTRVTFTATVVPTAGTVAPVGKVQFVHSTNGVVLNTAALVGGHAHWTTTALPTGVSDILARFVPANTNAFSGSQSISVAYEIS